VAEPIPIQQAPPTEPGAPSDLERRFVAALPDIERIVSVLCRRYGVDRDETEEIRSWVRARFVETRYAALAKFRGDSSLATYLAVVVATMVREYRVARWGRWRPSAAALREGGVAVRLEAMVRRQGRTLADAGEALRTAGLTTMSDADLAILLHKLPDRAPLRPIEVGDEPLQSMEADATDPVERAERAAEREKVERAIASAVEQLDPQDQVLVRLRFWEGSSIADISRCMGVLQKPLYRRLERAVQTIKSHLARTGVSGDKARAVLQETFE
jgi:RNA polymerase sigma factor for flagellar operon FliA